MREPTKDELRAQIAALQRENTKLQDKLDAEEQERWYKNKNQAISMFYRLIPFFPRDIVNLNLDHIDKAGYWFNFEITNDSRKQIYCVRHTDL